MKCSVCQQEIDPGKLKVHNGQPTYVVCLVKSLEKQHLGSRGFVSGCGTKDCGCGCEGHGNTHETGNPSCDLSTDGKKGGGGCCGH